MAIDVETDIIRSARYDSGRVTYERPTSDITSSVRILTVVVRLANAHGWDVAQLAESSGIPNELVWRLLDGNAALNTDDTARFAKAFGMSPLEIYEAAEKVVLADTDEQDDTQDEDTQEQGDDGPLKYAVRTAAGILALVRAYENDLGEPTDEQVGDIEAQLRELLDVEVVEEA